MKHSYSRFNIIKTALTLLAVLGFMAETLSAGVSHKSFSENGIKINISYPSVVHSGESFEIKAEMINRTKSAKQGGLTLSFPDMDSMRGDIIENNFASLKGYSYPDKIFNKNTRKPMKAEYYMVEGWHNKRWRHNRSKYFTIELKAPYGLDELRVNVRGVLWIKNSHDLREIPLHSLTKDQQGFGVEQFSIKIVQRDRKRLSGGSSYRRPIPIRQGMRYSRARKALLNAGWQTTYKRWQDVPEFGRERDFYYDKGWDEVDGCSGTGLGYCVFLYHDEDGNGLRVVTVGEGNDPVVDNWSRE